MCNCPDVFVFTKLPGFGKEVVPLMLFYVLFKMSKERYALTIRCGRDNVADFFVDERDSHATIWVICTVMLEE
eukprot:scaffold3189_cov166-Amphora_coffeaeformis.AAC.5